MSMLGLQRKSRIWLIAVMAVMLLGVQLLQYSPLHNHAREVVDCALCHLQPLGDDSEHEHQLLVPEATTTAAVVPATIDTPRPSLHSPYQGRAPPRLTA